MKWYGSEDGLRKNNFLKIFFLLFQVFPNYTYFHLPRPTVRPLNVRDTLTSLDLEPRQLQQLEVLQMAIRGRNKGLSFVLNDLDLSPGFTIY